MINHQDWQEQIPFYVAQSLSAEQRRSFESHLATCDSCQAEIDEWRIIASAVWREADDVARQLPPLSQEVYNRLSYRDKPPVSRYAANPPRPQPSQQAAPQAAMPPNVTVLPKRQRVQLPITMVAGLVVAVIFGGLLLMFALRDKGDNGEVALNSTLNADSTEELGAQAAITATNTDLSIIPTEDPNRLQPSETTTSAPSQFATNTPEAPATDTMQPTPDNFVPTQERSFIPAASPMPPSPEPSATPEAPLPLGGGPYITITPGIYADGVAYCEIYNPHSIAIELYQWPDGNSQITGTLLPFAAVRVISMSADGWYFVVLPSMERGWIAPGMSYLRGSCYAGYDIPFATPTYSPEASPTFEMGDSYEPSAGQIVVINAAYADLQSEANFTSSTMGLVNRDQQFPVLGYQGTGTNRFVNILLPDGRTAWVWAQIVVEYPANQAPPSPTPQP